MADIQTIYTAKDISDTLQKHGYDFTEERIIELANQQLIPYVLVDGRDLRFFKKITLEYVADHLTTFKKALPFPKPYPVYLPEGPKPALGDVPKELSGMTDVLYLVEMRPYMIGVYFLCKDKEVVYVGSSTNVYSRVPAHTDKEYDRAYYIIVPELHLTAIESAFIALLNPKYNRGFSVRYDKKNAALWVEAEKVYKTPEEIVQEYVGTFSSSSDGAES